MGFLLTEISITNWQRNPLCGSIRRESLGTDGEDRGQGWGERNGRFLQEGTN